MDRNYQYFWCLVFCFLFLVAFSSLTSITKAGERCSKITGKCFEWPIIADNTTMERMPTNPQDSTHAQRNSLTQPFQIASIRYGP